MRATKASPERTARISGSSMSTETVSEHLPGVLLACNRPTREQDVTEPELARLARLAAFRWAEFDRPTSWDEPPPPDPATDQRLIEELGDAEALIVCHGSPR